MNYVKGGVHMMRSVTLQENKNSLHIYIPKKDVVSTKPEGGRLQIRKQMLTKMQICWYLDFGCLCKK